MYFMGARYLEIIISLLSWKVYTVVDAGRYRSHASRGDHSAELHSGGVAIGLPEQIANTRAAVDVRQSTLLWFWRRSRKGFAAGSVSRSTAGSLPSAIVGLRKCNRSPRITSVSVLG